MKTLRPAECCWQSFAKFGNGLRSSNGAGLSGAVLASAALICASISSGCAQSGAAAPPETVPPVVSAATATAAASSRVSDPHYDPTALAVAEISSHKVRPHDWPCWDGWTARNNTPEGKNIPIKWDAEKKTNVKWTAKPGSQTY